MPTTSTISIHGLDREATRRLRDRARQSRSSLNRTIKRILEDNVGVSRRTHDRTADFEDLCGVWSAKEAAEFAKATAGLREVDAGEWR